MARKNNSWPILRSTRTFIDVAVVESLFPVALRLGRPSFVAEHRGFHLLKPPTTYESEALGFEIRRRTAPAGEGIVFPGPWA